MKISKAFCALAALAIAVPGAAIAQDNTGVPLSASLDGASEVPGPGDPDGFGSATVRVNPGQNQLCYSLSVSAIASATAAHIHSGDASTAGGVVVALAAPTSGTSQGCITIARDLALNIVRNPDEYYVNVHNPEFPTGAVRGQLSR